MFKTLLFANSSKLQTFYVVKQQISNNSARDNKFWRRLPESKKSSQLLQKIPSSLQVARFLNEDANKKHSKAFHILKSWKGRIIITLLVGGGVSYLILLYGIISILEPTVEVSSKKT